MTIFGTSTAVVSLGMSCQTAMQIRAHRELIGSLLNEPFEEKTTPFDWMICPSRSSAVLIGRDQLYPQSRNELSFEFSIPFWDDVGCQFWHLGNKADDHALFASYFEHLSHNFRSLSLFSRSVFLVSNTQNNLQWVDETFGGMNYFFNDDDMTQLRERLSERFPGCEMYIVSSPSRHDLKKDGNRQRLFDIPLHPDRDNVRGDAHEWEKIFRKVFGQRDE